MRNNRLAIFAFALITISGLMAFRDNNPAPKAANGTNPAFLFLSDVHLNTQTQTTDYGYDTGMDLWRAFLNKIDHLLAAPNSPGFIVYTGDLPAHYPCSCNNGGCYLMPNSTTRATHNANITAALQGLQNLAVKYHKAIFYLPGNNDGLAGDYFSFADKLQHTPLWLIPISANFFPSLSAGKPTPPCMVSDPNPTLGYYSAYPIKGLRLIALNTVIYTQCFTAVDGTTQLSDGNMQMTWLAGQLADAATKGEKVYIAMHVPPGKNAYGGGSMWKQLPTPANTWEDQFLNLTSRYKATIAGILYGHTHMDEVRRLYDTTGNITEVAISCPGVTPQHDNNPGFKIVQYDATSMELMDFTTYFTTPAVIRWGDSTYTFSKTYNSAPGTSIYQQLSNMDLDAVNNCMGNTFTVHNGPAGYDIATGIEVTAGQ